MIGRRLRDVFNNTFGRLLDKGGLWPVVGLLGAALVGMTMTAAAIALVVFIAAAVTTIIGGIVDAGQQMKLYDWYFMHDAQLRTVGDPDCFDDIVSRYVICPSQRNGSQMARTVWNAGMKFEAVRLVVAFVVPAFFTAVIAGIGAKFVKAFL